MTDLQEILSELREIKQYIKSQKNEKSRWMTEEDAMKEIGCKATKLKQLRETGRIDWRFIGEGRGKMYLRSSIDKYNNSKSTL